jgi:hypothetical protein
VRRQYVTQRGGGGRAEGVAPVRARAFAVALAVARAPMPAPAPACNGEFRIICDALRAAGRSGVARVPVRAPQCAHAAAA